MLGVAPSTVLLSEFPFHSCFVLSFLSFRSVFWICIQFHYIFLSLLYSLLPVKWAHLLITAMLLKDEERQMDKPFPWILQPCPPSALFPVLLCLMLTCACSPPAHPFTDLSPYSLVEFCLLPIVLPLLPPFLSVTTAVSLIKIKSHLSRSKPLPKNQLPLGLLPSLPAHDLGNPLLG